VQNESYKTSDWLGSGLNERGKKCVPLRQEWKKKSKAEKKRGRQRHLDLKEQDSVDTYKYWGKEGKKGSE